MLQGPFLGPDHQPQYLVNGQVNPEITIRPGETQRWRILNASANSFFNLQLVRHTLHEIATDGNPRPEAASKTTKSPVSSPASTRPPAVVVTPDNIGRGES